MLLRPGYNFPPHAVLLNVPRRHGKTTAIQSLRFNANRPCVMVKGEQGTGFHDVTVDALEAPSLPNHTLVLIDEPTKRQWNLLMEKVAMRGDIQVVGIGTPRENE